MLWAGLVPHAALAQATAGDAGEDHLERTIRLFRHTVRMAVTASDPGTEAAAAFRLRVARDALFTQLVTRDMEIGWDEPRAQARARALIAEIVERTAVSPPDPDDRPSDDELRRLERAVAAAQGRTRNPFADDQIRELRGLLDDGRERLEGGVPRVELARRALAGELARRGGDPSSLDDAVLAWLRARGQQLDVVADVEAYAGDLTARGDEAHLGLSEIPEPEARTLAAGTAAAADELAADAWRLVAQHLQPLGGEDRRARRAARLAAAALERAARAQRIGGGQSPPDDARRLLTAIRLPPPVPPPPERDTSRAAAIRLPPPVPPPPPEDDAAPASPVRVPPPPLGGAPGVRAGANPPVDSLVDSPVNPPSDVPPDVPPEENQPPADLPLGDDGAATLMATAPALSGGLGVTLSPAGLLTVRD